MKRITILLSLILSMFVANAQIVTSSVSWTNQNGNQTRTINIYVPSNYNANTEYALMIGFHGQGDNSNNYANSLGYYYIYKLGLTDIICVAPDINDPSSTTDDWDD